MNTVNAFGMPLKAKSYLDSLSPDGLLSSKRLLSFHLVCKEAGTTGTVKAELIKLFLIIKFVPQDRVLKLEVIHVYT